MFFYEEMANITISIAYTTMWITYVCQRFNRTAVRIVVASQSMNAGWFYIRKLLILLSANSTFSDTLDGQGVNKTVTRIALFSKSINVECFFMREW